MPVGGIAAVGSSGGGGSDRSGGAGGAIVRGGCVASSIASRDSSGGKRSGGLINPGNQMMMVMMTATATTTTSTMPNATAAAAAAPPVISTTTPSSSPPSSSSASSTASSSAVAARATAATTAASSGVATSTAMATPSSVTSPTTATTTTTMASSFVSSYSSPSSASALFSRSHIPLPPRGHLLRLAELTEEELDEVREECRLPLYLPRRLEQDSVAGTATTTASTAASGHQQRDAMTDSGLLPHSFRPKERMRTNSVALVMCLNIGVDPPDVVKISPCARMECWIDPVHSLTKMPSQKVLDQIGNTLQKQYERWQIRARYKQALDPTFDDVKKLCISLRKGAKDERVLFHYNGHGVPKPTTNGEIWVFNKQYTQYIPLSLFDLQQWMGSPSIYVYDCSGAGILLSKFQAWSQQHLNNYEQQLQQHHQSQQMLQQQQKGISQTPATLPLPPNFENCIQLAACRENECLPMDPSLPADIFTACLTTPINMALRCYVLNNSFKLVPGLTLETIDNIPGSLMDRRTMLGELNWIFTAITDTIAWNVLPKALFQKLFRQDLLVASLFRNFLLAERVMRIYDCNPQSSPALPKTFQHSMWQAWDLALDACLRQLPEVRNNEAAFCHSTFFAEQLTAFEVWLRFGSLNIRPSPPEQLPIVLQVLLSQVHRTRALELLGSFLDLGPWAVAQALSVGIFPYILKLLQSSSRELRPLLVFIWTKILAVDCSYQQDLVRDNSHKYFLSILQDSSMHIKHRTMAAFILSCLCANGHHKGQKVCMQNHVVAACTELLSGEPLTEGMKKWICVLLGRLWDGYCDAKWLGIRSSTHERLTPLLQDSSAEVRAAAVFALGTLLNSQTQRTDHADNTDAHIGMILVVGAHWDASPLVRQELVAALQWLLCIFDSQYVSAACQTLQEEGRGINNNNNNNSNNLNSNINHNNNNNALGSPIQRQHGRVKSATQFLVTSIVEGVRPAVPNPSMCQAVIATEQKMRRISSGNSLSTQGSPLAGGCLVPANTLHSQHAVTWKLLNALATVDPHRNVSDMTATLVRMYRAKAEVMVAATQRRPSRDHYPPLRASPTSVTPLSGHVSSAALTVGGSHTLGSGLMPNTAGGAVVGGSNNGIGGALNPNSAGNVGNNSRTTAAGGTVSRSEPSSPSDRTVILPRKNFEKALPQLREDRLAGGAALPNGPSDNGLRCPEGNMSLSSTLKNGPVSMEKFNGAGPAGAPATGAVPLGSQSVGPNVCVESSYQLVAPPVVKTDFLEMLTRQFQKPCFKEIKSSPASSCASPSGLASSSSAGPMTTSTVKSSPVAPSAIPQASLSSLLSSSTPLSSPRAEVDCDSPDYSAGEFRVMRNASVRRHAFHMLSTESWRGMLSRAEEHQFPRKTQPAPGPSVAALFHPYEPLLFVADSHQVTILNTDRMTEVDTFEHPTTRASFGLSSIRNGQPGKLSSMTLVNAHHDRCLLFTAAADGAVRVWANTYAAYYTQSFSERSDPIELVTAFNCMLDAGEVQSSFKCAGILLDWDQARSQLVTCGDMRVIRIWDMAAERRLLDLALDTESPVRCVSLDRTSGGSLLAVGTVDGCVRLYDRRRPSGASRPVLYAREHLGQVVGVHLDMARCQLISASVGGDVRYWQLAAGGMSTTAANSSQSQQLLVSSEGCRRSQLPNQDLTCMVVQPLFPGLIACGTQTANIIVQEEGGAAQFLKPHTDWFSGQKTAPVNAIALHPYKMCLATAYQDGAVSLYQRRRS